MLEYSASDGRASHAEARSNAPADTTQVDYRRRNARTLPSHKSKRKIFEVIVTKQSCHRFPIAYRRRSLPSSCMIPQLTDMARRPNPIAGIPQPSPALHQINEIDIDSLHNPYVTSACTFRQLIHRTQSNIPPRTAHMSAEAARRQSRNTAHAMQPNRPRSQNNSFSSYLNAFWYG
jgi:hypothetical protein